MGKRCRVIVRGEGGMVVESSMMGETRGRREGKRHLENVRVSRA